MRRSTLLHAEPWLRLALQAVLLAALFLTLARQRANTLFSNGRWLLGKETGKYLFYTYDFLFKPMTGGEVALTDCMGFQQLLYHQPENQQRRLRSIACRARLDRDAYLWIWVRKQGLRALGFRFSNHGRFPSGFYRYDDAGRLVETIPWSSDLPPADRGRHHFGLCVQDGHWEAHANGQRLARIADADSPHGYAGFQGSGWNRRPVYLSDVRLEFEEMSSSRRSRPRTVIETFAAPPVSLLTAGSAAALAVLTVCLRRLRQSALVQGLSDRSAVRLRTLDDVIFLFGLAVLAAWAWLVGRRLPPASVAATGVAAEIATAIAVAFATRGAGSEQRCVRGRRLGAAAGMVLTSAVALAAVAAHGTWIGWRQHPTRALREDVSLAALVIQPSAEGPSPPCEVSQRIVRPAEPCFTEGRAYREQSIEMTFSPSAGSVLDVVFQQQSFRTRGDPQGEALPLHRHLLRLSTRPDVSSGLSLSTDNRPLPLWPVEGPLWPDQVNRLDLDVRARGITLVLNGMTNRLPALPLLGFGETGLLAHDGPVEVRRLVVSPGRWEPARAASRLVWAALFPGLAALAVWALLWPLGLRSFREALRVTPAVLWMPCAYGAATLTVDTLTLASLGRWRAAVLNLAIAGSCASLLALTTAWRRSLRGTVWMANVLAVAVIAWLTAAGWVLLPEEHPLRRRFGSEAVVPGANVAMTDASDSGPWYHRNRWIGAHTYLWEQRLGGERVNPRREPGVIRGFVLGGSQAWGSGAASSRETFAEILERRLRSAGFGVEIFNAAANGGGIEQSFHLYQDLLRHLEPDFVLADVGLNETTGLTAARGHPEILAALIAGQEELWRGLCEACRRDGVDLILMLEPMCGETPLRPIARFYDMLERVALEHGFAVVRVADRLYDLETQYPLWWDTAHLSPYGHHIVAELLYPAVERCVRARYGPSP